MNVIIEMIGIGVKSTCSDISLMVFNSFFLEASHVRSLLFQDSVVVGIYLEKRLTRETIFVRVESRHC